MSNTVVRFVKMGKRVELHGTFILRIVKDKIMTFMSRIYLCKYFKTYILRCVIESICVLLWGACEYNNLSSYDVFWCAYKLSIEIDFKM